MSFENTGPAFAGHTNARQFLLRSKQRLQVLDDTGDDRVLIDVSEVETMLLPREALRVALALIVAAIRCARR